MSFIFVNGVKRKLSIILSVFILSFSISPMIMNAGFCNTFSRKNNNTFSQKSPTLAKVLASVRNVSGSSAKVAADSFKKFVDGALVGTGFSAGVLIAIIVLWKLFIKKIVNDAVNDSVNSVNGAVNAQRVSLANDIARIRQDALDQINAVFEEKLVRVDGIVLGQVENLERVKNDTIAQANTFFDQNIGKFNELIETKRANLKGDIELVIEKFDEEVKVLLEEVFEKVVDVKKQGDDLVSGLGGNIAHGIFVKPVVKTANLVEKSAKSIGNGVVSGSKGIGSWISGKFDKWMENQSVPDNQVFMEESYGMGQEKEEIGSGFVINSETK